MNNKEIEMAKDWLHFREEFTKSNGYSSNEILFEWDEFCAKWNVPSCLDKGTFGRKYTKHFKHIIK